MTAWFEQAGSRRRTLLCCSVLWLALLASYSNHFHNDFQLDDAHTTVENPAIRSLANVPQFFLDARSFSTVTVHQNYRPLTSASLALDYWLAGGAEVFYFHLSTFFWLVVLVTLLFFFFRHIMDAADPHPSNFWAALAAAACFGLHPACAETVNYVIQRADLYNTLGTVASLHLFARYPAQRKFGWYLLPVIAAILAKPPALIFPLILLSYVLLVERKAAAGQSGSGKGWLRAIRAAVPAALVCVGLALLLAKMTPAKPEASLAPALMYRATQPFVAWHYFQMFFLPTELSVDAGWQPLTSLLSARAIIGFVFVLILASLAFLASRRRRTAPIAFGIVWFFLALLPTSLTPLADVMNDHRMFFAFVGLALAATWSLRLLLFRQTDRLTGGTAWQQAALALTLLILLAAGAGTWRRNTVWYTEESLWGDALAKNPDSGRALLYWGSLFRRRADYDTAASSFEKALALFPRCAECESILALTYHDLHRDQDALKHFQKALSLGPETPQPHLQFAEWMKAVGHPSRIPLLEEAVRKFPYSLDARHALLQGYTDQNNWPAVARLARETLQIAPQDSDAARWLAMVPSGN